MLVKSVGFAMNSASAAVSVNRPGTSLNDVQSPEASVQVNAADAKTVKKGSPANAPSADAGSATNRRAMNLEVEEYNQQGKVRFKLKFSNNYGVYQIPNEATVRVETEMGKSRTSFLL